MKYKELPVEMKQQTRCLDYEIWILQQYLNYEKNKYEKEKEKKEMKIQK